MKTLSLLLVLFFYSNLLILAQDVYSLTYKQSGKHQLTWSIRSNDKVALFRKEKTAGGKENNPNKIIDLSSNVFIINIPNKGNYWYSLEVLDSVYRKKPR